MVARSGYAATPHRTQRPSTPFSVSCSSQPVPPARAEQNRSEALTRFHSRSPPAITVLEYIRRIVKYTKVEVLVVNPCSLYAISRPTRSRVCSSRCTTSTRFARATHASRYPRSLSIASSSHPSPSRPKPSATSFVPTATTPKSVAPASKSSISSNASFSPTSTGT